MRFFTSVLSLFAAVAIAQTGTSMQNAVNNPVGGFKPTPGQDLTLTWANPSSGTVTIKLQSGSDITPGSGIVLASGIQASSQSAAITIPTDIANGSSFTFEIIDESDPSNYNFSSPFAISGATGVSTMVTSTASSSGSSSSSTGTASSSSSSGSSSSGSSSTSSSSESSSTHSSSSSSSSTASRTSSSSSSRTSSSATMTATTAAPNSNTNSASSLKIEGSLIALAAGLLALF